MEFWGRKKKVDANKSSLILPPEMVTEILLRLHVKPLFRCLCLSKEWKSIITHQQFGHSYMQRPPKPSSLRGLWAILPPFVYPQSHSNPTASNIMHELDDVATPSLYIEDNNIIRISDSSNGLILCLYWSSLSSSYLHKPTIFNPLTKQSAELPPLPSHCNTSDIAFGLVTRSGGQDNNPASSFATYKVVCTRFVQPDAFITIFSSETGTWSDRKVVRNCPGIGVASKPFSCKGVLHWFDWTVRSVVTYDPYDTPEQFGRIQLPNNSSGSDLIEAESGMNLIQLGREDSLRYGHIECCGYFYRRLCIWRLVDYAKGEWCLEQWCSIRCSSWSEFSLLSGWRGKLVAPCLGNYDLLSAFLANEWRCLARDIGCAEAMFVERAEVWPSTMLSYRPITLCLWSSPFYRQAKTRSSSSSSSIVPLRKIPALFPSF